MLFAKLNTQKLCLICGYLICGFLKIAIRQIKYPHIKHNFWFAKLRTWTVLNGEKWLIVTLKILFGLNVFVFIYFSLVYLFVIALWTLSSLGPIPCAKGRFTSSSSSSLRKQGEKKKKITFFYPFAKLNSRQIEFSPNFSKIFPFARFNPHQKSHLGHSLN